MPSIFASMFAGMSISLGMLQVAAAQEAKLQEKLAKATFEPYARAPGYSEGPTWWKGDLVFCSGALMRRSADGRIERYLDINPAGTVLRGDGQLLICDNKHKAILMLSAEGKLVVLADRFEDKPLRSLNDLTVDARGNVYWTDPEGSSLKNPVGNLFRLRPDGTVTRIATGLAFPNGIDVDPASQFLYVIESQSKKILRYPLPADDAVLGKAEEFYDLGGSGGDGCAFDEAGNLWVADFHRPENKKGRITILSPQAKVLGTLEVPAEVVSNIAFGGPDRTEIFCTTGNPPGVYHAKVGVKGFAGHPGKPMKVLREIPIPVNQPASPVHPRRFGLQGGVGLTRGWYIWKKYDPETGEAEVTKDPPGEIYRVRVLPWATTYRDLVYGVRPDALLPGERVNLFFAPDEKQQRAYLVHFQDELCQMKNHQHIWEVRSVDQDDKSFTARAMAGDKPLEAQDRRFEFAPAGVIWRDGKPIVRRKLQVGEKLYLRWRLQGERRLVERACDDASLPAIQKAQNELVTRQMAAEGLTGMLDHVDGQQVQLMVFATHWFQANTLKPGQIVALVRTGKGLRPEGERIEAKLVSQKNRGTYGSGVNDMVLELTQPATSKALRTWPTDTVVRLIPVSRK